MSDQMLEQKITVVKEMGTPLPGVPGIIVDNLNPQFELRPYQEEAFARFIFYLNNPSILQQPTQLLYHMATGSGKTLIMTGLILYLYEQGYRNFLFFVNSTNIIEKTRDNFLNPLSSKYLFAENIAFGDKRVQVREVDNFQATNGEDISIVFSTIQGLHSRLNTPSENSVTYDDFEDKQIALISDEAHHINVETKKGTDLTQEEREEIVSWEGTVNRIFGANAENILLEFTATADLSDPEIAKKYKDKLIFDYPLKQFRIDGYSKEVKVLQADLPSLDRAMQAIILSQYRRKLFEQNRLPIKPVIMFKSRTIKESEGFYVEFEQGMKDLNEEYLEETRKRDPGTVITKAFEYFEANGITTENLVAELKEDFSSEKCILVNSKDESEEKQLAVNSLEDEDNEYRAVFAVDKLNEGWDVLNLFDIVRLYNTRDAKAGKPGRTTMSEAQLIGRGARYCPFRLAPGQPLYERKFDEDIDNELRVCEELYYYSAYNPRYIDELHTALEEIGIKSKEARECHLHLKGVFKDTTLYKTGFLFKNECQKYDRSDVFSLKSSLIEQVHKVVLKTGYTKSSIVFEKEKTAGVERKQKEYRLVDFGKNVIRKALNRLEFYEFADLKQYLPNLQSMSEFIESDKYLGKIRLEVSGLLEQIENLMAREKLEAAVRVLEEIADVISSEKIEFKGTNEFKPYMLKDEITDKTMNIAVNEGGDREHGISQSETTNYALRLDLSVRDWYVFNDNYGTSEEKYLVKFIDKTYEKLKKKYDEIFLVRNERHFKIYSFDDGRAVEPDFVLFLVQKEPKHSLHYQVFIEPKGEPWVQQDEWKETFLKRLKGEHRIEQLWSDREYIVWGMPFFNEISKKTEFEEAFKKLVEEDKEIIPFVNALPVYSLKAAAGKFGEGMDVEEEGWIEVEIGRKLDEKMFVAQVVGKSMEPKIPDGSYCVFCAHPAGTRQGKIVLVQHQDISDLETGGKYTVKVYESEKVLAKDGTWKHAVIRLKPLNPEYELIELKDVDKRSVQLIAELIAVLPSDIQIIGR